MTYINKSIIITCVMLNSCAYIDYRAVYDYTKLTILGVEDLKVDERLLDELSASFIKVKIGRTRIAILPLSTVQDNVFEWVGAGGEKIITANGRIIATTGLDHNVEILSLQNVALDLDASKELLISLRDPDAIISQSRTSYDLGDAVLELDQGYLTRSYQEDFKTNDYNWSGTNYYWIDSRTLLPIKTIASPHPLLGTIEIEYFYKYTRKK